jgi:hypothetical protein
MTINLAFSIVHYLIIVSSISMRQKETSVVHAHVRACFLRLAYMHNNNNAKTTNITRKEIQIEIKLN